MSRQNVEIVRRGFEAWQADDLEGLLALFHGDVVTRRLAPLPDPGTWRGPEGVLEVAADWVETFDEFVMRGEDFIDAGDRVVVRVVQEARGEGSRVPVAATFWFVYGLSEGKVVQFDMYAERRQALEAVGLSD